MIEDKLELIRVNLVVGKFFAKSVASFTGSTTSEATRIILMGRLELVAIVNCCLQAIDLAHFA